MAEYQLTSKDKIKKYIQSMSRLNKGFEIVTFLAVKNGWVLFNLISDFISRSEYYFLPSLFGIFSI